MKPRLYYLGKPGDGFGWGVANTNIVAALQDFCEVVVDDSKRDRFDAPVFVPVTDHHLNPARKVRAPRVLGYCFTEWPIAFDAPRQARQYDVLFVGSTWNGQRLLAAGVNPAIVQVLHQGIDLERFKLQPPSKRQGFVVFSGGKYEFRKGQDYVATAMRHFMAVHDDVVLLTAWKNLWPASMASMSHSWLLPDWTKPLEGLPRERVIELPQVPNEQTPGLYAQAHVGLFPNRCEAGTNLVMCEFMACGRPVIATCATGQADVFNAFPGLDPAERSRTGPYLLDHGNLDPAGWFNCHVSDILARLEHAYKNRDQLPGRGLMCRTLVERFTWRACAAQIVRAAERGWELAPEFPPADRPPGSFRAN